MFHLIMIYFINLNKRHLEFAIKLNCTADFRLKKNSMTYTKSQKIIISKQTEDKDDPFLAFFPTKKSSNDLFCFQYFLSDKNRSN